MVTFDKSRLTITMGCSPEVWLKIVQELGETIEDSAMSQTVPVHRPYVMMLLNSLLDIDSEQIKIGE